MNMFKKNGGFTLVELIVVIAIVAILAGIAVPAYSGYINSANEAADTTALGAVKTAAMAAFATDGAVTEIHVTAGEGTITEIKVRINDAVKGGEGTDKDDAAYVTVYTYDSTNKDMWKNDDFKTYMNNTVPTLKSWTSGAVWYAAETKVGTGASEVTYKAGEWTAK